MSLLLPPALRPGDAIAIVAPAGPVDRARIERAMERLQEIPLTVKTFGDLWRTRGYLAGDDAARTAEFNAALHDPTTTAVIPARGGYGITRLLDRIDYSALVKSPKVVTGFSDVTALHAAIHAKTGLVTFHSPNPQDGLGRPEGLSDLSARTFWRAVLASQYDGDSAGYDVPLTPDELAATVAIVPGIARGRLTGGNLALLCALLGTPYDVDTRGRILLLEDVDEPPYRIDRFLSQLRLAGKLDPLAGIIVGQFTDCRPAEGKPSLSTEEVLSDFLAPLGVPVLGNFPIGHTSDNATLPLGVEVEIDANSGRVTVLEDPVRL